MPLTLFDMKQKYVALASLVGVLFLLLPAGWWFFRPLAPAPTSGTEQTITVIYTNDEHGWLAGAEENRGAAAMVGNWQKELNYTPDGPFLVLSGGDMWTGPAVSTWFAGESMAEVMNQMGYHAAAVGNHEFDFGLEVLKTRADQSHFPFLAANIRRKSDGQLPTEWGILPTTIVEVAGVKIGLLGLASTRTPLTTNPKNVADLEFIGYETAVREFVPQLVAEGVHFIFIPSHLCEFELRDLAARITDLPVQLLGGGHCNELQATQTAETVLLIGGSQLATYAYATFTVNLATHEVVDVVYGTAENDPSAPADPAVQTLVTKWEERTAVELDQVIGYLETPLPRKGVEQQQLITSAWLWAYPTADVALTNMGGFRADIPAGELTLGNLITVFPFNNVLVELQLTGRELQQLLDERHRDLAIAGVYSSGWQWYSQETDQPLEAETLYTVLVNDFMYAGGDEFTQLAQFDPAGYNTAIDWRQPLIDWLTAQKTTATAPLDTLIQQLTP